MAVRPGSLQVSERRRRVVRVVGSILLAGVAVLFVFASLQYREITAGLEDEIQRFGSLGLVLSAFVVDTFGGPLGPEVPVVGGLLAGIAVPVVIAMTAAGSAVASLLVYSAGYLFGEYGALSLTTPGRFERWRTVFLRHRRITLTLGALTPVPYVTICLLGGVFRVRMEEFVLFAVCARFLRIAGATYVALLFQGAV
jgi:membrane protein YqaA with SNARE-associated domain